MGPERSVGQGQAACTRASRALGVPAGKACAADLCPGAAPLPAAAPAWGPLPPQAAVALGPPGSARPQHAPWAQSLRVCVWGGGPGLAGLAGPRAQRSGPSQARSAGAGAAWTCLCWGLGRGTCGKAAAGPWLTRWRAAACRSGGAGTGSSRAPSAHAQAQRGCSEACRDTRTGASTC